MLRDRYEPQNLFELVAALSLKMEPALAQLDKLLDDDVLFQSVRADLAQRYPHTQSTGRPSTPVEVILRMILVKHLYGWSYEQTEYQVSDSLVLRQFCRVYLQAVPGGIVSGYRILDGNPSDSEQLRPSLDRHIELFEHPPDLLAADRGLYSAANERYAESCGVKHIAIPKPGSQVARTHRA
jgi:hypothetical protein